MGSRVRAIHVQKALKSIGTPARILDAGSGQGCYSFMLARRYPQAEVTAVDMDQEQVSQCRFTVDRLGIKNLRFAQADLLEWTPAGKFDLILCIDLLEHIEDDEGALGVLYQALSPQGVMIVHVPRNHRLCQYHFKGMSFLGMTKDHVRDEYTEDEIVGKLRTAGFTIDAKGYTFGWFGSLSREVFYLVEQVENGLVRPFLKAACFPFLITLAFLDSLTLNHKEHQGFLLRVGKGSPEASGEVSFDE